MGPQRCVVARGEGGNPDEQSVAELRRSVGVEGDAELYRLRSASPIARSSTVIAATIIAKTVTAMTIVARSIRLILCP
jgi:hypothetical protein